MTTLPSTPAFTPSILKANEVYDFASHLLPYDIAIAKAKDFNTALVRGVRFAEDPSATDIEISNLAKDLGIGGKIAKSTSVLSAELAKRKCTAATLTPFDVQQILGKTDGNSGEYTAMAIGFFSAASIIASKVANGTAADHTYLYSRFSNIEIKTGFVNGQTVFAVCSFPYVHCNGSSGVHIQIAGEVRNAGFELLHLNEEQQGKWGFEWGITAEQMRAFTNYAPSHCISEIEVNGKTHGIPLFDKTALNQIKTLNAFVQYVAKWESLNHDAFEALESADEQDCEATEPAPETETTPEQATEVESSEPAETTDVQDCISGPTESSGSALAPAGATALALPATAPIFVPEAAITVNKSAPCFFRDVNAGLCSVAPKFSTDAPEATANGPLAPERSYIDHLSFDYLGRHHYELDYSPKGWLWTFDDFVDMDFRGFDFKAEGLTLAELGAAEGVGIRYLGKLVAHIEKVFHLKLGALQCPALENIVGGYNQGKGLTPNEIPTYSLLGLRIEVPVRREQGSIVIDDDELGEWRATISGYVAKLLCDAGFDLTSAVAFIKGWEAEVIEKTDSFLDYQSIFNDLNNLDDLDDIPF